ncbi:hypothetical protein Hanom_Chr05g00434891 [Helianthus anomalus]
MHVTSHFAVSWDAFRALAEHDRVREFIRADSLWDWLFELSCMPTYREILVDFLASFEFHPRRPEQVVDPAKPPSLPEVSFRMAGQARSMSLAEFARRSCLYTEAKVATDLYTQVLVMVDKPTLLWFWAVIAHKDYSDHVNSKGRVTRIHARSTGTLVMCGKIHIFVPCPRANEAKTSNMEMTS